MRRARLLAALLCLLALLNPAAPAGAVGTGLTEYEIKAAFIYQFTKFIEWPADEKPVERTLCILGRDPFGKTLNQLEAETIRIRRVATVREAEGCHLLFVSASERSRLREILRSTGEKGLVTIGELEGFIEKGGLINFIKQGNRIRFEINHKEAERQGIKISSKLLSLAANVIK